MRIPRAAQVREADTHGCGRAAAHGYGKSDKKLKTMALPRGGRVPACLYVRRVRPTTDEGFGLAGRGFGSRSAKDIDRRKTDHRLLTDASVVPSALATSEVGAFL